MRLVHGLFLLCLFFVFGCSVQVPFIATLPDSNLLVELNDSELFAVRPDGDMLAYVADGLHLLRLSDNYRQQLTYDQPEALIWTPDGSSLVTAFREPEKTRLVRLGSSADDRPQIFVDEQITDFDWLADGRLLAMAQTVESENGVLRLQASLLIWDGQWDVEKIPLYTQRLYHQPTEFDEKIWHYFDLSPLKDELIYNRYLDPPTLDGRVELVLYNLQTGRELVLAETDNRQLEAFCAADGETVLLPNGSGQVLLTNPWTKKQKYQWQSPGESLRMAPLRDLFYVDGKLYVDDRLQLSLPVKARARFSAAGTRLFVAWQRKLYLYSGYTVPEEIKYSKVEKVKLQRLRQQRSLGEISIRDYYQKRNNVLNP